MAQLGRGGSSAKIRTFMRSRSLALGTLILSVGVAEISLSSVGERRERKWLVAGRGLLWGVRLMLQRHNLAPHFSHFAHSAFLPPDSAMAAPICQNLIPVWLRSPMSPSLPHPFGNMGSHEDAGTVAILDTRPPSNSVPRLRPALSTG